MSSTVPTDYHALLKRALLSLEKMQAKLDAVEQSKSEPLAVIGLGCRFPGGADSPEKYWQLLRDGVDAITEVPSDRWDIDAYYDARPGTPGKMNTRYGGFITEVDRFEPQFFGIAPREAISMDPQQRLVLEVAWEALEHAGQAPDKLAGTATGVFIGINNSDYARLMEDVAEINTYTSTGVSLSIAAGRLSYVLGLQGPSLAVDTACSSSLVAVHLACQSLRNGECRMALAGGVNLILSPLATISLCELSMMAPDGRCKAFDAAANGFVRGEGCGMVVLKRMRDALADGDTILALIRGTAINQDGRSSGLTAPNGPAQEAVIRQALADGRVKPEEVSYVETHGTGTSLGDPIEVGALGAVLGEKRSREQPLMIGSVKTNIGHLEAAAGVSGLMKVVLALQNGEVPPHLHLKEPSPHISWTELPVVVPRERQPWAKGNGRRLAGVSSFGFGGTNAHVILEEAPVRETAQAEQERPLHLLTLSARSQPALKEQAQHFSTYLNKHPTASLPDICFTANTGRTHFSQRLAAVAKSTSQMARELSAFTAGETESGALLHGQAQLTKRPQIAFLFTGQGAQYAGMGQELFETHPAFRESLERCDELLQPYLKHSLLSVLYGSQNSLLDHTSYTQPAMFALAYALTEVWRSWGVEPNVVLGHSAGEYVAACVAGVFTLHEGLKLIAARGRLMQAVKAEGAMGAVFADEASVRQFIRNSPAQISIAAVNGPNNTVISGASAAVEKVLQTLEGEGVLVERLRIPLASHSPLMDEVLEEFEQVAEEISYSAPQVRIVSNVTGELVDGTEVQHASYWPRHLRETVQFSRGIETLTRQGCELFVEVGPSATLLGMAKQCKHVERAAWMPSLRRGRSDWQQMLESLAELYVRGVKVDWARLDAGYERRKVSLPSYPFQRERFWIKTTQFGKSVAAHKESDSEKRQEESNQALFDEWLYDVEWRQRPVSSLAQSFDRGGLEEKQRRKGNGDERHLKQKAAGEQVTPLQNDRWLILADRSGIGAKLAQLMNGYGERGMLVYAGQDYQFSEQAESTINPRDPKHFERLLSDLKDVNNHQCSGVVYLWSLDSTPVAQTNVTSLEEDQYLGCCGLLHLVQALVKREVGNEEHVPRVWLITRNAQGVNGKELLEIAQAPLWGFGRVIALEHPEVWGGLVDLDSAPTDGTASLILAEISDSDGEDQIAYRQGKRYIPRLVRSENRYMPTKQRRSSSDACYLITGGLGGLGLKIARWLVESGARHLVLTGRKPFPLKSTWENFPHDQEAWRRIAVIQDLENHGATVQIVQADTSDMIRMSEVFEHINSTNLPLRGLIHAAADINARTLKDMDRNMVLSMLRPKVVGTWVLHELTKQMNLDFFISFSSITSLIGSMHLSHYAAANHFLDAFALYRKALNLPILNINWGRWAEDDVPYTETKQLSLEQYGLNSMRPDRALEVMGRLLAANAIQKTVAAIDWRLLKPVYEAKRRRPLLEEFDTRTRDRAEQSSAKSINFIRQLQETSPARRRDLLIAHVQGEVTRVLGFNVDHSLDTQQGFFEMGMDSLTSVELKERLEGSLGCSLHATVVFEYSSVQALAEYLDKELFKFDASAQAAGSHRELATESSALQDLSKDDLLALLAAELGETQS